MPSIQVTDPETDQPIYINWDGPPGSIPTTEEIARQHREAKLKIASKAFVPSLVDAAQKANLGASKYLLSLANPMYAMGEVGVQAASKLGPVVALARRPIDWSVGRALQFAAERSQKNIGRLPLDQAAEVSYGNSQRLAAAKRMMSGSTLGQEFREATGTPQTQGQAVSQTVLGTGVDFATDPAMLAIGGLSKLGRLGAQLQYVLGAALTGGAGAHVEEKATEIYDAVKLGKIGDPKTAGDATDMLLSTLLAGFGVRGLTKGWSRDNALAAVKLNSAVSQYVKKTGMSPESTASVFREALKMLGNRPNPNSPYFKKLLENLEAGIDLSKARQSAYKMDEVTAKDAASDARVDKEVAKTKVSQAEGQLTRIGKERDVSETPAEIADLVDRLGEAVRSHQAKRNLEWEGAVHESTRAKAEALNELSAKLRRGEITADEYGAQAKIALSGKVAPPETKAAEFAPDEADALLRYVATNPELLPMEQQRAHGALRLLIQDPVTTSGPRPLIEPNDVKLLGRALGKRFVDAQYTEPFTDRQARAQKVIDSLKAEAAAPEAAYESAKTKAREIGKAVTRETTRGKELMELLDPSEGAVGSARPPSALRHLANIALDATISSPRAISASDLGSWVFRQGLPAVVRGMTTHPIRTGKTVAGGLRDFFDESHYDEVTKVAIDTHPAQALVKPMGLRLGSQGEGIYEGAVAHNLPVISEAIVKPSERSFESLSKLRLDLASDWDAYFRSIGETPESNPGLYSKAGDLINNFTGTSKLPGAMERAANFLGMVNFAPRYRFSRWAVAPKAAVAAFKYPQLRRPIAGITTAYATAVAGTLLAAKHILGATVEADPRSSDLWKMKWGNTRIDLGAGFNQVMTLIGREVTGQVKSTASGEVKDIPAAKDTATLASKGYLPPHPEAKTDGVDLILRYLESGASPAVSYGMDVARGGKDIVGRPAELNPLRRFRPFTFRDVEEASTLEPSMTLPVAIASQLGMGVQTYSPSAPKSKAEQIVADLRAKQGAVPKPKTVEEKIQGKVKHQVRADYEARIRQAIDAGDKFTAWDTLLEAKGEGHRFPELRKELLGADINDDEEDET